VDLVLQREFLRHPTRIATVTGSSAAVVAEMIRPFPARADPVVVELGPGTGRVTDALQRRLGGRGRHVAIELNPLLAERLARRHPAVTVVCADAATVTDVLADAGIGRVDLVCSLLPWAAHRAAPIPRLVAGVLAPDGAYTQVVFSGLRRLGPGRRLDRDTRRAFLDVQLTGTIWRSLPPARVRVARLCLARP
jgi:phospholipid N-methyltransferase